HRGEIFGLLGPNGAGKTTTLEMIEGLRKPDSGELFIDGHNVQTDLNKVKEVIGVQLQSTSIYNNIRVAEALKLFGGYYKKQRSADELLKLVALEDKRTSYHKNLSGGQQQRFAIALALVNDPTVVFLDEPTTGLDPQARRNLWDIIAHMRANDKTVILTTHYMEEAERLCDRILILDHGRKIAEGAPRELVAQLKIESCLEFSANGLFEVEELEKISNVTKVLVKGDDVELFSKNPHNSLLGLMELAKSKKSEIQNLHVRRPTLEDLFLELTGRSLRE
ncbi:ATP-binding cassette domain-containing protein, partial [candidate division KSB1 bacterium]|nr:ATP-binding cassette domain-containing protein [candidate division KSB1 bacterium]